MIEDWGSGYLDDFPDGRQFALERKNSRSLLGLLVTPGVVVVTKLAPSVEVVSESRTRKRLAR